MIVLRAQNWVDPLYLWCNTKRVFSIFVNIKVSGFTGLGF